MYGSIDFELSLPQDFNFEQMTNLPLLALLSSTIPECSFKLKELKGTCDFTTATLSGLFAIGEKQGVVSVYGALDAATTFSPTYYNALEEITKNYISSIELQSKAEQEEKALESLLPLIPKLYTFGTIRFRKEGLFEVDKKHWTMRVAIPVFEVSTDLYTVALSFDASNMNGKGTGSLIIRLQNYKKLIDDLLAYFNRFVKAYDMIKEAPAYRLEPATDKTKEKLFSFLQLFTEDPSAAEVVIPIRYDQGAFIVGRYTEEEFTPILQSFIHDILMQIAPEALPKETEVQQEPKPAAAP
jgi:hypothetical protein